MTDKLTIAHLNARSIRCHLDGIVDLLSTNTIDILSITETWLDNDDSSNSLKIDGYTFFRRDYRGRGSGVGFYVKNGINCKIQVTSHAIEQLCLLCTVKKVAFNLCV